MRSACSRGTSPDPPGAVLRRSGADSSLVKAGAGEWLYTASEYPGTDVVSAAESGDILAFDILAPVGYDATLEYIMGETNNAGVAGAFLGHFELTLIPTNVSFHSIEIREVGMIATNSTYYFAEPAHSNFLSHTDAEGANAWNRVGTCNDLWGDDVGIAELSPPWGAGGRITWPIPNEYRKHGSDKDGIWFCDTNQRATLYASGTVALDKFGWMFFATTNRTFGVQRTGQ